MSIGNEPNDLLVQVSLGNQAAFRELYRLTSAKLFAVSLRITRQEKLSEEALQDAFLTVWQRAAQFDPDKAQAVTWIGTIIRNRSIDLLRRHSKHALHEVADDELLAVADSSPTPEILSITQEQAQALHVCLGELDNHQQAVIKLAYLDGYTREEIALHQQVPVGTVKTWIHRGVEKMKACLNRAAQSEELS